MTCLYVHWQKKTHLYFGYRTLFALYVLMDGLYIFNGLGIIF